MDRQNMMIFLSLLSLGLGMLALVSSALLREARKRLAQAELRVAVLEGQKSLSAEPDRLALVEGELEAVHAHLDRLTEGQEFLTRVLTQHQGSRSASPKQADQITPH